MENDKNFDKITSQNFKNVTLFINNVLFIDIQQANELLVKMTGREYKQSGFTKLITRGFMPKPDLIIKKRAFFNKEKIEFYINKNFIENEKLNQWHKLRHNKFNTIKQEKIDENQKIKDLQEKRQAAKNERLKRIEKRKGYINPNLTENPFKEKQSNNDNISDDEIDTSGVFNPFLIAKKGG